MRKLVAILGSVAVASIIPATPALAEGSVIISGELCGGFVPTPEGGIGEPLLTSDSHQVIHGRNIVLTCHFDIPAGKEPSKGTKADGIPCTKEFNGTPYTTYNSRMSASPGGRATAKCTWDISVLGAVTTKKKK